MSPRALPELLVGHWAFAALPSVLAALAAGLYLSAALRVPGAWPWRRTLCFLGGLGAIVVALESGLDAYDDQLVSVHMEQHMLLLVLAPMLLLGGRPLLLAFKGLPTRPRRALARLLARARPLGGPLPALALFTVVVLATHLPGFYDATLRHAALHELEHALYLLAGLLLFLPLIDADPAPGRRMNGLVRLIYVIAAMVPMSIVGAYLNRASHIVYGPYGAAAHALGISAMNDQAQAGAIMWVAGGVAMAAVGLWSAMSALIEEERRQRAREAYAEVAR